MCPVEVSSDKVGGVYVDGIFTVLPYTVESGEKKLISQKHPAGFQYLVFGTARGGYYMEASNPFNHKFEIETAREAHVGPLILVGKEKTGS